VISVGYAPLGENGAEQIFVRAIQLMRSREKAARWLELHLCNDVCFWLINPNGVTLHTTCSCQHAFVNGDLTSVRLNKIPNMAKRMLAGREARGVAF
jgi:hypothetical protein